LRLDLVLHVTRIGLAALPLAIACAEAPQPPEADAPSPPRDATTAVAARGVELRLPQAGGGEVSIAGDALALDGDGNARLDGDVRVRSEGGMRFEATAGRASLSDGGRFAELAGGVRAVLEVDGAGPDAGAIHD
jgi:hypothetical protein